MKILGIESSCDETACAVVEDGKTVLQLESTDGLRCTVWFEQARMIPLRAELITDGRVSVYLELSDWHEGPPDEAGEAG